jgi:hypothetical protein
MNPRRTITLLQINDTHGYGPARMLELAAKLNHPLLACNCYVKATGELAYPAFTVIERSGVRVGIIGIAATILDKTCLRNSARACASRWAMRNYLATSARCANGNAQNSWWCSRISAFRRT